MSAGYAPFDRRRAAIDALVSFYETMSADTLDQLGQHYSTQARFIDPFNDVTGLPAIRRVFEHMFTQVEQPRFEVVDVLVDQDRCVLIWLFRFGPQAGPQRRVQGASHLQWDEQHRVILHRDYWDPARELYEHLPLIGWLMRALRRRLSAH